MEEMREEMQRTLSICRTSYGAQGNCWHHVRDWIRAIQPNLANNTYRELLYHYLKRSLHKRLFNHRLNQEQEPLSKAYGHIREYY